VIARYNGNGRARGPGSHAAASLLARGEPMVWLTGAGLVTGLLMVVGLVGYVFWQGLATFWPKAVVEITTRDGEVVQGEVTRSDDYRPGPDVLAALTGPARDAAAAELEASDGWLHRRLVRTGNFEITGQHFRWVDDFEIPAGGETRPDWAMVLERVAWGRFYGSPTGFLVDGEVATTDPAACWDLFREHHAAARAAAHDARAEGADVAIAGRSYELRMLTATGNETLIDLADIVRAYPANHLGPGERLGVYFSRWAEFLTAEPREANSEGGVMPAIFGTVVMTLAMTLLVVPFGVMAALYLREYARAGLMISMVRIAINNLAGVPSIVFGVFGLGFFSYLIGGSIDAIFFADRLPNPTFGTGGIMWASLTLALLTLPVVIVATEEALAAVPTSMREGSFACGATKWQTIRRVVLPRALPGIMTGAILAMARGAGEVAPLMLVGAVKLAPELPVDLQWPFLHLERSFMHLGFHIYDLGFQSQNSEAAKPMVFTTTMLLMAIVLFLNAAAIWLRSRLTRKFVGSRF
jgi:phosphate transport system permease protein